MTCWCGARAETCMEADYHCGPGRSAADRESAIVAEQAWLAMVRGLPRALPPPTPGPPFDDSAERVAAIAAEQARFTRWCAGCDANVYPVYPRQLACHRCGEAFDSGLELAAE